MNKYFEKIIEYFEEENISYKFDDVRKTLIFDIVSEKHKKKLRSFILEYNEIFQVNIGANIKSETSQITVEKDKISEYIHRANLGMIRGNFEYDIDNNTIAFKHYFEKKSVMNKQYTMYNILLPTAMFIKYLNRLYELFNTSISPKELIDKIESEINELEDTN